MLSTLALGSENTYLDLEGSLEAGGEEATEGCDEGGEDGEGEGVQDHGVQVDKHRHHLQGER